MVSVLLTKPWMKQSLGALSSQENPFKGFIPYEIQFWKMRKWTWDGDPMVGVSGVSFLGVGWVSPLIYPAVTEGPGLGERKKLTKGRPPNQVILFQTRFPFLWFLTAHCLCEGSSRSYYSQCIVRETEAQRGLKWGSVWQIQGEHLCALSPSSSSHHQKTRKILGEVRMRREDVLSTYYVHSVKHFPCNSSFD